METNTTPQHAARGGDERPQAGTPAAHGRHADHQDGHGGGHLRADLFLF